MKIRTLTCVFVLLLASVCTHAKLIPFRGDNGKWGFKNEKGAVVVAPTYAAIHESGFSDGLCAVSKKKPKLGYYTWGFVDETGRLAIPCRYYLLSKGFSEGKCPVLWAPGPFTLACAYIDKTGKTIIRTRYTYADSFLDGYAVTMDKNNYWKLIDQTGTTITSFPADVTAVGNMHKGYFAGTVNGKVGILDTQGQWVVKPQYDEIMWGNEGNAFDRGYVKAKKDGVVGYIDHAEKWYSQEYVENMSTKESITTTPSSISEKPGTFSTSDVDVEIPETDAKREETFVVILANENYKRESVVDYAANDGSVFKEYCEKTLGIPSSNVHYVQDATLNDMRAEVDWLTMVAKAFDGDARLMFYYAGHGVPDEESRSSYLIPVDGYGANINTGYRLSDLYSSLASVPAKSVVVLLDACFSGAQRDGDMLASARGVAIKAKPEVPKGNMVVLSAASGDETAYKYEDKKHGMFTYYLLKKLKDAGEKATISDIAEFVRKHVSRTSIVQNSKPQTPTVMVSPSMENVWEGMTL